MSHFEKNCGTYAWIGLGIGIAVYDTFAPETLSHAVDRALDHPQMKYVAYAIGGLVAGHLFNAIPEEFDPIHKLGIAISDFEDTL